MFHDGPIDGVLIRELARHDDARGWLVELFRRDELPAGFHPAMAYLSETQPGVTRGPHEHAAQSDYFAFIGPGNFLFVLWDARPQSATRGHRMRLTVGESHRTAILVPPGVVHAYRCEGPAPGWVVNCPNQLYGGEARQGPLDEIRHELDANCPYRME